MKIAIRFKDNDFGNTFRAVATVLMDAYKHNGGDFDLDKVRLAEIVNNLSLGCYLSHQTKGGINTEWNESVKKHIRVSEDNILINEEVDHLLNHLKWGNSETVIINTDLDFDNNNPIFLL